MAALLPLLRRWAAASCAAGRHCFCGVAEEGPEEGVPVQNRRSEMRGRVVARSNGGGLTLLGHHGSHFDGQDLLGVRRWRRKATRHEPTCAGAKRLARMHQVRTCSLLARGRNGRREQAKPAIAA